MYLCLETYISLCFFIQYHSSLITYIDMCRDSIAELEIVPLLLQSLQLCFASPKFKIQCLITLAACIEGCGKFF
jgi:hypothetical protein